MPLTFTPGRSLPVAFFCLINCLILALPGASQAQNKLYMNPVKYTDRRIYTYNHICSDQSQIHLSLNGQPMTGYSIFFFNFGLDFIEFPFGTTKPGDVLTISDDCGSTPFSQTVTDDYVYVEIPAGQSHASNGIPPGDETAPYSRLSTPLALGRCEPLTVGAHGLHTYGLFVSTIHDGVTTQAGTFLINGTPLTTAGHIITNIGKQTPVTYTVGANGSLAYDGPVKFTSQQFYSGQTPLTLEYHHNGAIIDGDLDLNIGAMTFRYIKNTGFAIQKATYTSAVSEKDFTGDYSHSVFKLTYDGHYFRAYVDDVLVDELERFVVFEAQAGSLSNTGVLPYGSSVTFSPTQAGSGWIGVLVDGVLYTRQQLSIADELTLNPTVINASCSGSPTGQISLAATGGKAPFQYNLNGGAYSAINTFTGLASTTYTVGVRDASGCTATRTVTVSQPPGLGLAVASQTNVSCSGNTDGAITLSPSGGTAPFQYSQDGTTYGASASFTGLSAGAFTFSVKDVNGCSASESTTLTTQSNFGLNVVSRQHIACSGGNTGAISVTTTGNSVGAIQYAINGGALQTSAQFTGLGAGTYTLTAQDNLCQVSLPVSLNQPPALGATAAITQAIHCYGGTDGMATITASGGVAAYQFSADGTTYQAATNFSGLSRGNYKYWVKDANGCVATTSILPLDEPAALQLSVTNRTDALCFGGATGSLTVAASGGTAPYTYARTGTGFGASGQFTGLVATGYALQAKDANGCLASTSVTIGQPALLQGGISSLQAVACSGGSDGALSLSATGGTSPYSFARDGSTFGSGNTFSSLSEGTYTLTIRDANSCQITLPATIGYQSKLLLSIAAIKPVGCYGESTGGVTASATGSTAMGTLLYSVDGTNYQPTAQFAGLAFGSYTLHLKDNLCQISQPFVVTQPTALAASASVIQAVACWGGSSGVNRVSASGGTTPYQYSANGTAYQSSTDFSNLAVNSYTYWVKDANGCVVTTPVLTLSQPSAIQLTVTDRNDVLCFGGATGSLTVAASGGTAPYTYARTGTGFGASGQFTGLVATGYALQAKDANGCLASTSVIVGQPAVLQGGISSLQPVACAGGADGALSLSATGGTSPYSFARDGSTFGSGNTFSSLSEGTYTLTIRDANSCQITLPATIGYQSRLLISVASIKPVACNGDATGGVMASAAGSTLVGTALYSVDGTHYQASPEFAGLASGTYTLRLKDNLCQVSQSFVVTQPTSLSGSASVVQAVACWGGNSGLNRVSASGGTTPYQYSASGTLYQTATDFASLPVGSYTYWVKDANGCTLTTSPISLTQPPPLVLGVATRTDVRCYDGADGVLSLSASGGTPGYSYALPTASYQPSSQFAGLRASSYTARVQDAHGCLTTLPVVVGQPQAPFTLAVTARKSLTCYQDNGGQFTVAGNGGTAPYQYALNNGQPGTINSFTGLAAGTYLLSGKDAQGCTAQLSGQTLTQPDQIVLSLLRKVEVDCEYYTRGEAQLSAIGGNGSYVFSLSGQDRQGKPLSASPTTDGVFKALAAGNYVITAHDEAGCTGDYTLAISARNPAIRFSVKTQLPASCQQATGQIVVENVGGGRPPYSYGISSQANVSSSPQFDNLTGGSYLVTVADSLCAYTQPVSLSLPGSLQATYAITPRDCRTPNADLQLLSILGGSGSYQTSLNNGSASTSRSFQNLAPGIYSLRIDDVPLSCPTVLSLEILPQNGAGLRLTNRQAVRCWQSSDGLLTVTAEATTGPFRYAIDGGSFQDSPQFAGLAAGQHKIVVQNRLGCIDSMRVQLTQPPLLNLAVVGRNNDCFGDQTGALTAAASGGVSPYAYSTDGTNYVTTTTLGQLRAGAYSIRVRDANGCVTTQPATLDQPPLLTLQPLYADTVRCFSEANGLVQLLAGGGTPAYRYSIDSVSYGADAQFSNLKAGRYSFWVQDSKQCRTRASLVLSEPAKLQLSLLSQSNPLCYGDSSGTAQVLASGGNGGYQYQTDNGRGQQAGNFTGLTQASYGFRVIDRRGCSDTTSRIRLSWPSPITSSSVLKQPRCWGEANGQITVSVQGGTAPYQATGPTTPTTSPVFAFTGLAAGPYVLPFTDAHGCRYQTRLTLEQPTALSSQTTVKPNDCFGDQTGAITVTGQGATAPYLYSFDGDPTSQPVGQFDKLRSGTYPVRIVDAHGCLLIQPTLVPQPTAVTLQAVYADTVRCFSETNGRVQLLAGGGTPGYQYSIDSLRYAADSQFGGLRAGTYQFWVQDGHQCRTKASLTLTEPTRLQLRLLSQLDPLCYGDSSGKAQVVASGGNGGYQYTTNNGLAQSSGSFTGLTQASYGFRVVDRRGCSDTTSRIRLSWPSPITSSSVLKQPRCWGEANGQITVSVQGGTAPYQATGPTTPTTSPVFAFTGLAAGPYVLPFTDAHGCRYQTRLTLEQPTALSSQTTVKPNDCFGDQTGAITVTGQGATAPYRYAMGGAAPGDTSLQASGQFTTLRSATYSIRVVDAHGCQLIQPTLVPQPTAVTLQAIYADTVRCFGETNGRVQLLAGGGVSGYRYAIDTTRYFADPVFNELKAGTYTFWVKDQNGCRQSTSLPVTEPARMRLRLTDRIDPLCAGDQNGIISVAASGGNSGYAYWLDNRLSQKVGRFVGLTQAEYTLKAVDRRGCEDTIRRVVLTWPKPLAAAIQTQTPRCFGDANGAVGIQLTGGAVPYGATLLTGSQSVSAAIVGDSLRFSALSANSYEINTYDANGCQLRIPVRVTSPQAINPILLGDSSTTCRGQLVKLDANNPNLTVVWYLNGAELTRQSAISVTQPGTYSVSVTNQTGCVRSATYVLKNSTRALQADFLIPTQAFVGDTVVALDITKPIPDAIEWSLPKEAFFVSGTSSTISFVGVTKGEFMVRMKAVKDDCINIAEHVLKLFDKQEIGNTDPKLGYQETNLIQAIVVFPNPNYGRFTVKVTLANVYDTDLEIVRSLTGETVFTSKGTGKSEYIFDVSLRVPNGIYVIRARAGNSSLLTKAIILD